MKTFPIHPVVNADDAIENRSTCSSSALIALRVLDDSMSPEFMPDHIAVVDNSAHLYDGAFVVVQIEEDWLIRRWKSCHNDSVVLEALSDDFDNRRVHINAANVKGVVVQRAGRRRKDRRHYRPAD